LTKYKSLKTKSTT